MTRTSIILKACLDDYDYYYGISCSSLDFAWSKKKAKWFQNLLSKTLMAICYTFFAEERTGEVVKPSVEDVLNA
jgi:hypothetical protein